MNADTYNTYDDYSDEPDALEARLQRIEGELEDHLPEDQRLQSSIPGGGQFSDTAYPAAHERVQDVPRTRSDRSAEPVPSEPSFADFYEPGIADVDPDEVLGRDRHSVAPASPSPARANRSVDSLRQILADLGAAPEDASTPDRKEPPTGARMDEGLLELQPDELAEPDPEQRGRRPFIPVEADFLRQSGLTDATRGAARRPAPAPQPALPAEAGELRDRLGDLPAPQSQGDLDKALAMARSLERAVPKPIPTPRPDLEAVQAYLEALQEQVTPPQPVAARPGQGVETPCPPLPAAPEAKRPIWPVIVGSVLGTILFLALLYLAYLMGAGMLRID